MDTEDIIFIIIVILAIGLTILISYFIGIGIIWVCTAVGLGIVTLGDFVAKPASLLGLTPSWGWGFAGFFWGTLAFTIRELRKIRATTAWKTCLAFGLNFWGLLVLLASLGLSLPRLSREAPAPSTGVEPQYATPSPTPPAPSVEPQVQERLQQARTLLSQGRYREALQACEEALHLDPHHPEALRLKQRIQQIINALGEGGSAELNPPAPSKPTPPAPSVEPQVQERLQQARTLLSQGRYREALQACEEALHLDPHHPEALRLKQRIQQIINALGEGGSAELTPPAKERNLVPARSPERLPAESPTGLSSTERQEQSQAGTFFIFHSPDMYAVRINGSGNPLWSRTYGGGGDNWASAVAGPLADGGFLLVGHTKSAGAGGWDMYAVRIDGAGNPLWSKTYGGSGDDRATAVAGPLADGGFLLVGYTKSFGGGYGDMYAVRIDGAGNPLWSKTYGGSGDDYAYAVAGPLVDGGFLLVGGTLQSFGAGYGDMYAVRIDGAGNPLWSKTYGGSNWDVATAVAGPLADGGFLLVGWTLSSRTVQTDMYAVRIDQKGNVLWSKTYGGSRNDYAYAVAGPLADGGFLLVGRTGSFGAGYDDMYAVRIDGAGNLLWSQTYGGGGDDNALAVAGPLADGGFLLVGWTQRFGAGYDDMYAVRIDQNGNVLWSKTYGGRGPDRATAVVALPDGGFLLVRGDQEVRLGLRRH